MEMSDMTFFEKLDKLNTDNIYPFHMPGHKRLSNSDEKEIEKEYKRFDITEIPGYDDLHDADGIIKNIENLGANLYNADECHILVNGSTCGILSAVFATISLGKKLLLARNSHKSVYNGVLLKGCPVEYVYAKQFTNPCICGGISPQDIENVLVQDDDIGAVYITSPTYEGIISDVKSIAGIVHKYKIPLIVDAAHGAHLGFSDSMANKYNMVFAEADIVIISLHKTLNAPTQSAAILLNGNLVNRELLRKYLGVFQTSSPSYVMMGLIDNCFRELSGNGETLFNRYEENLEKFYKKVAQLKLFRVITPLDIIGKNNSYGFDISKIVITFSKGIRICGCEDGYKLLDVLFKEYGICLEYASKDFALAMTSYMDTAEGFERLFNALSDIELKAKTQVYSEENEIGLYPKLDRAMTLKEAEESEYELIDYRASENRVAADNIYAYPPGIPIIVGGELISKEAIECMDRYRISGILIKGMDTTYSIKVLL